MSPLAPFLTQQGYLILDGGLATELERRGYDLRDPLWSARILLDAPDAIRQVHLDYLRAGADCVISASYQATPQALRARGFTVAQSAVWLQRSVTLAAEARDLFLAEPAVDRLRPLVAASVGPYGAYLANGAEYTGAYDLDRAGLVDFHRERWEILAGSSADILACETIPSYPEALALAELLAATPERYAWFSFSCRDGQHISDGAPLATCLAALEDLPNLAAVGINCTAPRYIPDLIAVARAVTRKPILVYPNSGEQFDAAHNVWIGSVDPVAFAQAALVWYAAGAALIGGCCRTGPTHIAGIRAALAGQREGA